MNPGADKTAPRRAISVSVTCAVPHARINSRLIKGIVREVLELRLNATSAVVNVAIVTGDQIARLNRQYLGHEGPTDVIAFEYPPAELTEFTGTEDVPGFGGARPVFGDVFVCLDVARTQAAQYRTTWQKELIRYVVHGLLHLAGHTDSTANARRRMKHLEDRLLHWISQRHDLKKILRDI